MSRLAQEIPQEIIQKAWEAGANRPYEFGDVSSLTFDAMTRALAAVIPDLQRPLLEEIKRLREDRLQAIYNVGAKAQQFEVKRDSLLKENARLATVVAEQRARLCGDGGPCSSCPQRDSLEREIERVRAENQSLRVLIDARPDLTAEEMRLYLEGLGSIDKGAWISERRELWRAAREKLERSLDAR